MCIGSRESAIQEKDTHINKKDVYTTDIESTGNEKDIFIGSLKSALQDLYQCVSSIESSAHEKDIELKKIW